MPKTQTLNESGKPQTKPQGDIYSNPEFRKAFLEYTEVSTQKKKLEAEEKALKAKLEKILDADEDGRAQFLFTARGQNYLISYVDKPGNVNYKHPAIVKALSGLDLDQFRNKNSQYWLVNETNQTEILDQKFKGQVISEDGK